MKTIGLLGGTSWPSTIEYYRYINSKVNSIKGGFHSANIILKSIEYHDMKSSYGENFHLVPELLKKEVKSIINLNPDCILLCNNTLHKALDTFIDDLNTPIPFIHIVNASAKVAIKESYKNILLLGTKFTMEDGYYENKLNSFGLSITVPNEKDRNLIQEIQTELSLGNIKESFKKDFAEIIKRYNNLDAAILACTELPLIVDNNSPLPIIDTIQAQCDEAIDFAL